MNKKLSKKERNDVVTKGYLEDQNYITKGYLKDQDYVTKEYLKIQNYVTKDYLSKELKKFRTEFRKEINEDFKNHITVLTEHYIDQLQVMFEGLDGRYVLRREWKQAGFGN